MLRESAVEIRLGVTLFLLLLGIADFFGAWQVRNFAAFTPKEVAATVAPESHTEMTMVCCSTSAAEEKSIDLSMLDHPKHQINRELLVQDTHVHVPVYAIAAALLTAVVCALALSTSARIALILGAFGAPFLDFAGLWGGSFFPAHGVFFGAVALVGGFSMGIVYLIVLVLALVQSWFHRPSKEVS
jgi:hypothetical protein